MWRFFFLISVKVFFYIHIYGQSKHSSKSIMKLCKRAENEYKKGHLDKAKFYYMEAIKKDTLSASAFYGLANLFFLNMEFDKAYEFYLKTANLKPNTKSFENTYFYIAKYSLKKRGDYKTTLYYSNMFLSQKPSPKYYYRQLKEANQLIATAEYAISHIEEQGLLAFTPILLKNPLNNFDQQYFPSITGDGNILIFTARNNKEDENIYQSILENDQWSIPQPLSSINSKSNEGTASISANGRVMVFTICEGGAQEIFGICDLFITFKVNNQWSSPKNLGRNVNSRNWESQPALSADGRKIYFVSDRPGGIGGRDIWVTEQYENGNWSYPKNLKEPINTQADEVSPYIHTNNISLYYSSNGNLGFGGFDIFSSEYKDSTWSKPKNLGYPLNNHLDQIGLFFTANGEKGYFGNEQNISENIFKSKLYYFDVPEQISVTQKSYFIKGKVYDQKTLKPIGAAINLIDLDTKQEVGLTFSDKKNGSYTVFFTHGGHYALYVNKEDYLFKSLYFDFRQGEKEDFKRIDIPLDPIEKGKTIRLNNLFFSSGSYKLEKDSKIELDKLIEFLKNRPQVIVEIAAHTDNIGTEETNQLLSEKRAENVMKYLTSYGIKSYQLKAKGYGEKHPISANDTPIHRAINRRIELKILEIN